MLTQFRVTPQPTQQVITINLTVGDHNWIVDSGATNHMTYNSNMLVQKKLLSSKTPNQVHLPNGDATTVTHPGSCSITKHDNIQDVLVIPAFKNNILSMSKLTRELQCSISFFSDFFVFQDLYNGQVKVIGRESDGLHFLPTQNLIKDSPTHMHSFNVKEDTYSADSQVLLWHQRLGHTSSNVLANVIPISSKA